jgi:hypothetical protein
LLRLARPVSGICRVGEAWCNQLGGKRQAIDKARETGAGRPGLGADKFEALEHLFRGWQQQVAQEPHREVSDGTFRLVPQFLVLVVAEANPQGPIFNLNCDIVHQVSASVTLRRLEAEVTTPSGRKLRFKWNVFYDFRPCDSPWNKKMTALGVAHEIEVAAGSSSLGVQFVGPDGEPSQLWLRGWYKVDLYGQTNKESSDDEFDTKTSFAVAIDDYEAGQVKYWSRATKAEWDRLNDPDRAIGIPVRIYKNSIATTA